MKCYGLGLGLDSFKMVALTENFRKLEPLALLNAYSRYTRIRQCLERWMCGTNQMQRGDWCFAKVANQYRLKWTQSNVSTPLSLLFDIEDWCRR